MPTYDYRCGGCGHTLELFQSITESPKRKCPACGKLRLKRMIGSGAGIIFKGSGFYETDYRSESYRKDAKKEEKAREGTSSSKDTEKKVDKKPEAGGKASDGNGAS